VYSGSTNVKKSHATSSYKKKTNQAKERAISTRMCPACSTDAHHVDTKKNLIAKKNYHCYAYPLWTPNISPSIVIITLPLDYLEATFTIFGHVATTTGSFPVVVRTWGTDSCNCGTIAGCIMHFAIQFVDHLLLRSYVCFSELWNNSPTTPFCCLK